jgi:hypothetical protein
MSNALKFIFVIIGIIVLVGLAFGYQLFQYHLCQKVTHGGFWYCFQHSQ